MHARKMLYHGTTSQPQSNVGIRAHYCLSNQVSMARDELVRLELTHYQSGAKHSFIQGVTVLNLYPMSLLRGFYNHKEHRQIRTIIFLDQQSLNGRKVLDFFYALTSFCQGRKGGIKNPPRTSLQSVLGDEASQHLPTFQCNVLHSKTRIFSLR